VPAPDRPLASTRLLELCVAALLMLAGIVVMYDSVRVGMRWVSDGPQAGYFPFYIGVLLCVASLWSFAGALLDRQSAQKPFVSVRSFRMILAMLVPTAAYVALIGWLGFYVASFAYIGFFMVWLGKYSWLHAIAVAAVVSAIAFMLFEVWFKLPLPKGPLEALLGLG
jgi:hypothetical protein